MIESIKLIAEYILLYGCGETNTPRNGSLERRGKLSPFFFKYFYKYIPVIKIELKVNKYPGRACIPAVILFLQ